MADSRDLSILFLPDEILSNIFDQTITFGLRRHVSRRAGSHVFAYRDCAALARVCRRFHQIATPVMYRQVTVSRSMRRGSTALEMSFRTLRLLHRSLGENESLQAHCRWLEIRFGFESLTNIENDILFDIVQWLTSTRRLSIRGYHTEQEVAWELLESALSSMKGLEHISLNGNYNGPDQGQRGLTLDMAAAALEEDLSLQSLNLSWIRRSAYWGDFKASSESEQIPRCRL